MSRRRLWPVFAVATAASIAVLLVTRNEPLALAAAIVAWLEALLTGEAQA